MSLIFSYVRSMLPFMIGAFPPILFFRMLRIRQLKRQGRNTTLRHELCLCLFLMFCAGLASQTILPQLVLTENGIQITGSCVEPYNLVPFRVIRNIWQSDLRHGHYGYLLVNIFGNILLFLPFGFFPALLWQRPRFLKSVGITFLVSLTVELCQIFQPRVSDIDDLILNVTGGMLGYGCFLLFRRHRPQVIPMYRVKSAGLMQISIT